jgi:hypothetical protein
MTIVLSQAMQHLSLPQLTTIQGNLTLGRLPLNQLDIGRLQSVGGTLNVGSLCNLPWSQVSHLASIVASPMIDEIGCCTGQTTQHACSAGGSCSSCN